MDVKVEKWANNGGNLKKYARQYSFHFFVFDYWLSRLPPPLLLPLSVLNSRHSFIAFSSFAFTQQKTRTWFSNRNMYIKYHFSCSESYLKFGKGKKCTNFFITLRYCLLLLWIGQKRSVSQLKRCALYFFYCCRVSFPGKRTNKDFLVHKKQQTRHSQQKTQKVRFVDVDYSISLCMPTCISQYCLYPIIIIIVILDTI